LRFQFSMHLKFWIIYNWKSYVLFTFELWYHVLLGLLPVMFLVVFVVCVVNMTMKRIFLGIGNKVHVQIQTYIVVVLF
jgi:hypothetical protein